MNMMSSTIGKNMMFRSVSVLLSLWLVLVSGSVQASEKMLRAFFDNVQTLQASFTQRVEDEQGSTLESASGMFYLSRPGKFRWDYNNLDEPDLPGQKIVADGQHLFFYDPDLEQVSRRSLSNALGQVPSLLLVQEVSSLDAHFSITDYGLTDGLSWVALKPKDEDAGYQQLMIGFSGKDIHSLLLYDGLGNSTKLTLSELKTNIDFRSSRFDFAVPEGADLLVE